MKATRKEEQLVVTEIAERLKDIVYATGKKESERLLHRLGINEMLNGGSESDITFSFRILMCAGDIQQIVARHRRGKYERD